MTVCDKVCQGVVSTSSLSPVMSPSWDFPGGPVVKTPHFHCRGFGFHPWSGILHALLHGRKKKLPLLLKFLGRGFMTIGFLLEDLSLGRKGKFRESLSLHLLLFRCLQLKTNMPKQHILGWHVLNSASLILEWHILLPFTTHYYYHHHPATDFCFFRGALIILLLDYLRAFKFISCLTLLSQIHPLYGY